MDDGMNGSGGVKKKGENRVGRKENKNERRGGPRGEKKKGEKKGKDDGNEMKLAGM